MSDEQASESSDNLAQQNHPLHGVGLEAMLGEVVRHYGWPVLAEQIPIKCFQSYPTFASSKKFLRKTEWARQRLEAFYLYKFKSLPRPSDDQYKLPPRERLVDVQQIGEPTKIELGDNEFFDDPESGPVFASRKSIAVTQAKSVNKPGAVNKTSKHAVKTELGVSSPDPWAKWK